MVKRHRVVSRRCYFNSANNQVNIIISSKKIKLAMNIPWNKDPVKTLIKPLGCYFYFDELPRHDITDISEEEEFEELLASEFDDEEENKINEDEKNNNIPEGQQRRTESSKPIERYPQPKTPGLPNIRREEIGIQGNYY